MKDTDHRIVLLITTVSVFMTAFMGSSTNIALPTIGREFAMDAVLLSWVAMAYTLANAMSLLPVGRLADILGRRRIFTVGVSGYVVASLAVGLSASGTMLIAARFVQGAFASMMFATSTAILISVFPAGERGRVLGINTAAVYTGLSVGPFVGGLMTQTLGWRSIFLAGAMLGLLSIALVTTRVKGEWAEARGERFDARGALIYGIAIVSFMYGLSLLPKLEGAGLIAVGLALGVGFVLWEGRAAQPLVNLDLFRHNRGFALSNVAALINYSATAAVGFLLSLYLQYIKALTPQQAGLVLIAQPVVQAVFSPITGRLSDRIESRVVASVGMAITAVGLVLLTFLSDATPFWYIVLCLILLGFGFALFSSPNTNAVMSSVERRWYGVASATVATMRTMGMMLSLGIAALIFAVVIGRVQITPQYYPAFLSSARLAFSIFAAACFAGVFASLARGKMHGGPQDRNQASGVGGAATGSRGQVMQAEHGKDLPPGWPSPVRHVSIISSSDGRAQPAAFYDSGTPGPKPLLVALHTWSYDYDQEMNIPYAAWCIAHDWLLIAPSFRGPNNHPEAAGSELAVQDVLDAVDYACQRALSLPKRGPSTSSGGGPRALSLPKRGPSTGSGGVDMRRIYLAGVSGGGHMALLMAGRAPDLWAAVSAWVPISDLAAWHAECRAAGRPYAGDLERSCGGAPGDSPAVDAQYRARSPVTYLHPGIRTPFDINAGIHDGHTGSVPISHTLQAFNAVAAAEDRIGEADIAHFVERAAVPPHLAGEWPDSLYGAQRVLFRRQSNHARVTIFDGGHEIIYDAALAWLAQNVKRET